MGTAPHCPRGGGAPCSAVENQVSLEPADLSSNPDFAISKHGPRLDIPASVSSSRERVPTPQKEESRKDTLAQGSRGRRAAVLGRVNLYHRTLPAGQRLGLGQWEGRGRREAPRNTLVIPRSRTDATAASRSSPPAWRGRGGRGGGLLPCGLRKRSPGPGSESAPDAPAAGPGGLQRRMVGLESAHSSSWKRPRPPLSAASGWSTPSDFASRPHHGDANKGTKEARLE